MLKYIYGYRSFEVIDMIDKDRVRLMTKMAKYEDTKAKEDFKIIGYYKKDYASFNTWITAIWITIGYGIVLAFSLFLMPSLFIQNLTIEKLINVGAIVIGVYVFVLVTYCVYASSFFKNRYDQAHHRVKKYYQELTILRKRYMKEKR